MSRTGHALFAYGTLLFPEVVEIVVGRSWPGLSATLPDHRRARLVDRVYPGVVEAPGDQTAGMLYTGLDEVALAALDRFEDVMYERRLLSVKSAEGPTMAHVYVVAPRWRALVTDEPWGPAAFAADLPAYLAACRGDPEGPAPKR